MWQLGVGYGECVTDPADLEQVPIKVVPMFIEEETPTGAPAVPIVERIRVGVLGSIAVGVAALALVTQVIAILVASANDFSTGTVLGYLAIGLSVLGVAGGIAAVVTRRGRPAGAVAIAIGIVGNPLIVLWVLRLLDSVRT